METTGRVAVGQQPVSGLLSFWHSKAVRNIRESIIGFLLFMCGFVSILVTVGIILSLFTEAIAFFFQPEVKILKFLTGTTWRPLSQPVTSDNFGILPLVNGTLMIAVA